jgi:hypothetical protein
MRVTVSLVVNLVANEMSTDEIVEAYPYLKPEDIRQALRYVAWLAEETVHPMDPMSELRPFGLCAGEFTVPDDFNATLPENTLEEFEGKS